jgi:hypothetical protein
MDNKQIVKVDTLRYKKNKLAANLALLGLVFNCLYFMLVYAVKTVYLPDTRIATKFVSMDIGFSVVLTLVVLLVSFLSSEGIKGYNKKFCIVLLVLAVFQIVRIFYFPLYGLQNDLLKVTYLWIDPKTSTFEFIMLVIYLVASAACYIASAVVGYINCVKLEKHIAAIESGELDIDKVLKEEEVAAEAAENSTHSSNKEVL